MLIGNLTRDPELRYTPQGTAVCSFGLATNRSWLPEGATERREETEFHRIVAWNKLAELCAQLLSKGRKVYVEGRLQTRSWTAQDGTQRTVVEIVIDDMIILDSRRVTEEVVTASASTAGAVGEASAPANPSVTATQTPQDTTAVTEPEVQEPAKKEEVSKKAASDSDKEEKKSDDINPDDIPF
jgi:single-strand DNA-binding protein